MASGQGTGQAESVSPWSSEDAAPLQLAARLQTKFQRRQLRWLEFQPT